MSPNFSLLAWMRDFAAAVTNSVYLFRVALALVLAVSVAGLFNAAAAQTAQKLVSFETADQEILYESLLQDYRCLKCQNQNLADSNADLAGDLRLEIQHQVSAGKNRSEIDDYLVARYGDFVLYKPMLKPSTLVLWFGPFLLLLLAGGYALKVVAGHRQLNATEPSSEEPESVKHARSLLDD